MAEWLTSLTCDHLPLTAVVRAPMGPHVRKVPAALRNVGGSTQVPARAYKIARRGTWGLPPP